MGLSRFQLLGISVGVTVVALGTAHAITSPGPEPDAPRAEQSYGELPPDDFDGPAKPLSSPVTSPEPTTAPTKKPRPSRAPAKPRRSEERPAEPTEATDMADPPPAGYPGPDSTGVPAGTKLRVHRGDLVVRKAGKVIDGVEVHGLISVEAPDVTIRNTRVIVPTGSETAGISNNHDNAHGMLVRNVEVRAEDAAPGVNGVLGHDFTLERAEIHHVTDQVHITGGNVTVRDSWFHDNYHFESDPYHDGGPSHDDSIQILGGGDISIRHNRFDGAYNAGVQVTQGISDVTGVTIRDNLLGGGGCTVNIAETGHGPVGGLEIHDNRFLSDQRIDGCAIIRPSSTKVAHSGNVWHDSGRAVGLSRG